MSATINMKTVSANRLVITKVILSPASDGRKNDSKERTGEETGIINQYSVLKTAIENALATD